ncbi:hypothetical protein GOODEAATRI_014551 [Goodea atripinnis]|uniref:Uncharacterized protein n=1 Tax=Goodea atripinnis TaxID=208336 RepID=A0ABV0P451_9TELE
MMVSYDCCTHTHDFLHSSFLTHMAQMCFFLCKTTGAGKKNRRAQPMFVMAVGSTFPIFNPGMCSDAKNLLQCHRLPGRGEREEELLGAQANLLLSLIGYSQFLRFIVRNTSSDSVTQNVSA